MDLDALIADAKAKFEATEPVTQDVLLGSKVVGVRFWPIPGPEWRDLVASNPPRPGAAMDQNLGYNVDAVVRAFPKVALVDGDEVDNMIRRDAEGREFSKWPEVHDSLSGADLKNLAMAVWGLHEWDPQKALVEAGKALKGGSRKKRNSPANSASQSGN